MKVRIANLPADVTESDIRGLLEDSDSIRNIELFAEDDTDKPIAVVEMDSDGAGEGAIELINGRNWKDVTLRADKLLY